jgi:hypothetical protein
MRAKILLQMIVFLTFVLVQTNNIISQESGWVDKGSYQEQKLKISEILKIFYSEDGDSFSSFSNDFIYRKWSVKSGNLISEKKLIWRI